jgi:hypothetical protein
VTGLALRRSAGRAAVAVMLAIVAAHLVLRPQTWRHEWMWATYQYGFVTILLGPLVAGVAAWEGWRMASAADLLATSSRARSAALRTWAATLAWGLLAYAGGLLAVLALVRLAGTPGWPGARELGAAVPPVALLAAEAALGLLCGWWLRHVLAAPAAAVGCFLLSLWLYAAGPSQFVTVGGATASLVGLAPRPRLEAAQVLCYAAAALVAILLAGRPRVFAAVPTTTADWVPPAVAAVALGSAAALLLGQGETTLEHVDAQLTCLGSAPAVCVAPGYVGDALPARAALLPYLARMRAAGVRAPSRFSQDATPGQRDAGPVDASFLLGDHSDAAFLVLNTFTSKACFDTGSTRIQDEWEAVLGWLQGSSSGGKGSAGAVPAPGPVPAAVIRRYVADLSACGR